MHILCCTDHNYIMPTGVMICSVCENNKDSKIVFHIISDSSVTKEDKESLNEIIGRYNHQSEYYSMESINSCFFVGKQGQNNHLLSLVAYYRLFLANLLPDNIDKVLYLDGDIIVRGSLKELYNTNLDGLSIAAVPDSGQWDIARYEVLGYPSHKGYFNSGVLLVNIKYWRENNLLEQFVNFATAHPERLRCHDQDILNYVLNDSKILLPIKYNLQNGYLYNELVIDTNYVQQLSDAIHNPTVLHYSARVKPWFKYCGHPYKDEFFKYRALTKWKSDPLVNDNPDFRQKIRRICFHLGILKKLETKFIPLSPLE